MLACLTAYIFILWLTFLTFTIRSTDSQTSHKELILKQFDVIWSFSRHKSGAGQLHLHEHYRST